MRSEFPNRSLWLDAGDQFTGTVEKERTKGELMTDFYNIMKVDSVAIGNHEWDNREPQLRTWMTKELGSYMDGTNKEWSQEHYGGAQKNLYLAANLKLKEGKTDDLPNYMPTKIFELENKKIKIGVIGLITLETVAKTQGFNKDRFDIFDYKKIVEQEAQKLRTAGCQAVLILSHVGTYCKKPSFSAKEIEELYELKIRNKSHQAAQNCDGEMAELLGVLAPNTVDGVVAGHIHESAHHFFKEVPVIQNPMSNIFTNLLYLKFKKSTNGEFSLLKGESLIEGPIPLCNKVYSNNKKCNVYQELNSNITLQDFTFHGSEIVPDHQVEELFKTKYSELTTSIEKMKKDKIFTTEFRLERDVKQENVIGNLITDIIRKVTNSDIAMDSPGSLRYVWDIGVVSAYELNNMFPFGGNFAQTKLLGKDVIRVIKQLQTQGKMGYIYAFSGIKMTLLKDATGKLELDENNVILTDGTKLDLNKEYTFASSQFMLGGGDDMYGLKEGGEMKMNIGGVVNPKEILKSVSDELKSINVFTKVNAATYMGRIKIINKDSKRRIR